MFELDKARELPFRDYVYSQVRRVDDRVLPPPPDVAVYFGSHKEAFAEMRRHPEGADEFSDRFLLNEILIAHALAHRDWDDLGAAWEIQRALWRQPRLEYTALTCSRLINAAARKLPPPAPRWLSELFDFDARRAYADAVAAEAKRGSMASVPESTIDGIMNAYGRAMQDDWARAVAEAWKSFASTRACGIDSNEYEERVRGTMGLWNIARFYRGRRYGMEVVARFTVERELTAKTLETKSGHAPSTLSKCSDGHWIVTPGHLHFSKSIKGFIPLEY